METLEIEEQTTEAILLAGLLAQIRTGVRAGADVFDLLDHIPREIHADVIEGLDRLGLI